MAHTPRWTIQQLTGHLRIYFNWSANALFPINGPAADVFLKANKQTILQEAQKLLQQIEYHPGPIYRGILLKTQLAAIPPHDRLQYLSFSTDRSFAEYAADINGFGAGLIDLAGRLGRHGYVIEYTPKVQEVLFHYDFLSILPYAEAFSLLGMDGHQEVDSLRQQREIMILQPQDPFTQLTYRYFPE